jgi:beta-glucanase (GH16 family)
MMRIKSAAIFIFTAVLLAVFTAGCELPALERFTAPPPNSASGSWSPPSGKTLAWSDEFDGPDIDLSKWSYQTEATGWSPTWNSEWQRYTDNREGGPNACINDGVLVIRALRNYDGDGGYTSARLVTKDKCSWQYGVIVARMQLPYGNGMWPAFWLMGNTGAWPANGEIDVLEMIGGTNPLCSDYVAHAALHWDNGGHQPYGTTHTDADRLTDKWHYYELEWTDTQIQIKFDGITYLTRDITPAEYDEFRQPAYALLNLAVGGSWGGYPDGTTVFPQYMYIDWVRVYQ